jgi:ribokinase
MQTRYNRKPIVVVGSINADLVARVERIPHCGETVLGSDFQIHPGGKGANQAVAVARLGYPVFMIGKLGSDAFGPQLRKSMSEAGVDVSTVATVEGASGVALIEVDPQGENSIVVAPGANNKVSPDDIDANIEILREAGFVLVQLEIPLETVVHLTAVCAREHVPVILDPAPAQQLPPELLHAVSWFTPNETEARFYTGGAAAQDDVCTQRDALFTRGIQGLVLKMGARGVYLATPGGGDSAISAFRVKAIDTTAAGDAFNGAFATGLMLGKDPVESARFASAAAAISVTRPGAQSSMASLEETEALLHRSSLSELNSFSSSVQVAP